MRMKRWFCALLTLALLAMGASPVGGAAKALTTVDAPALAAEAYMNDLTVTAVVLSVGVRSVGDRAFSGCANLISVIAFYPDLELGEDVFADCPNLTLYAPADSAVQRYAEANGIPFAGIAVNDASEPAPAAEEAVPDSAIEEAEEPAPTAEEAVPDSAGDEAKEPAAAAEEAVPDSAGEEAEEPAPTVEEAIPDYVGDDPADYAYVVVDGECVITGYTGPGGYIALPAAIDGAPVTAVNEWALSENKTLTGAALPPSLRTIGDNAFAYCENLGAVELPEGLESIGVQAFYGCKALRGIEIPSTVRWVGGGFISMCEQIAEIGLSPENPHLKIVDGVLYDADVRTAMACGTLEGPLSIPEGVEEIAVRAFMNCGGLTELRLPASLRRIGFRAFWSCYQLTELTLPAGVEALDGNVFAACNGLSGIEVEAGSAGFTGADGLLFGGGTLIFCSSLLTGALQVPEGVTAVEPYAFYASGLERIALPEGVTELAEDSFVSCASLREVELPASLTAIDDEAFRNCAALTLRAPAGSYAQSWAEAHGVPFEAIEAAEAPDLSDYVGDDPAGYEYQIEDGACVITGYTGAGGNIAIPAMIDGAPVTTVRWGAFSGNDALTGVKFPPTLRVIEDYTFAYCEHLEAIELPEGLERIGEQAFYSCDVLQNFVIPSTVKWIGGGFISCCDSIKQIQLAPGNPYLKVVDDVIYDAEMKTVLAACNREGPVNIPEGVTEIAGRAFMNCGSISAFTLPSTLRAIGEDAFFNCFMKEITIPAGVEHMEGNPFNACFDMQHITVEPGNANYVTQDDILYDAEFSVLIYCIGSRAGTLTVPESIREIGERAINCGALTEIALPEGLERIGNGAFEDCYNLKKIEIPSTVREIGSYAFAWNKALTEVTIPDGVTELRYNIFFDCTSLERVVLPASVVEIQDEAFENCEALTLCAPAGSYAQSWAEAHGVPFEAL